MPLQATSGAASYDAFGGGVATEPNYIESVFSCFLYTGNGSTQTITNGIDLAGKGGLVWIKNRTGAQSHNLYDTARGRAYRLASQSTAAQTGPSGSTNDLTSFNTNGFSLGTEQYSNTNDSAFTYASWTFRKQPKFFDVVTYTGDGTLGRTVSHNLGSVPGCIIIKNTGTGGTNWGVYHRSVGATGALFLNRTYDVDISSSYWNNTEPTSTVFTVGNQDWNNQSGESYVAYVFAHDAGGFGLTGTDNVISCGSYVATGNDTITLGWEPQFIIEKPISNAGNWIMHDNMRGLSYSSYTTLNPNLSNAEASTSGEFLTPTATGYVNKAYGAGTIIYIAIRRGPMKVPTSGTSVFNTVLWTGNQTNNRQITGVGFNPDFVEAGTRSAASTFDRVVVDRLRGTGPYLVTYATQIEQANSDLESFDNDGITVDYVSSGAFNNNSNIYGHFFKRAPSFFDIVCYTGTGSTLTVDHNLQATPELIIIKRRNGDSSTGWVVYESNLGFNKYMILNQVGSDTLQYLTATSSTTFTLNSGGYTDTNSSGNTYVAYLFATCAGVSKVFSYTGNGSSQTINCGFTGGARFVLIKRTDVSSGNWFVWDTARGIVSGNDPYLSLNTTAAEVTSDDSIDTNSTGFVVNQVSATNVNVSSATYIGLAIA